MGSDMVVALSRATVEGHTLFGHNNNRPMGEPQALCRVQGRAFVPGETVRTSGVTLPQVRQTVTVIAARSGTQWGFQHGVNEHGVAVGRAPLHTRLAADRAGLTGPDLVRLMLERATCARQAVDLASDLISRHGQGAPPPHPEQPAEEDSAFLIADAREAFVLAATGSHWAIQEVAAVRALNEVCQLRQDWDRISPGLGDLAIGRGWWREDGSKLDFEGAVGIAGADRPASVRRWGRATLLLEQQHGHVDLAFLRRLLSDHFEGCEDEIDPWCPRSEAASLCQHGAEGRGPATATSLLACLDATDPLRIIWCGFGPPCTSVYFPLLFEGEIPAGFRHEAGVASAWQQMQRLVQLASSDRGHWLTVREVLTGLQARFDQDCREFLEEGAEVRRRGDRAELGRLAGAFMQHNLECFEDLCRSLLTDARQPLRRAAAVRAQERLSQTREL